MNISIVDSFTGEVVEAGLADRAVAEEASARWNEGQRLDGREDRYIVRAPKERVHRPSVADVLRSYMR